MKRTFLAERPLQTEKENRTHSRDVTGRRLNVRRVGDLNVGRSGNQAIDSELGCHSNGHQLHPRSSPTQKADRLTQRDQVLFDLSTRKVDVQRGVAILLDDDGGEREARLLSGRTDEADTFLLVLNVAGRQRSCQTRRPAKIGRGWRTY